MLKKITGIFAVILLGAVLFSCAAKPSLVVTEKKSTAELKVKAGEIVEVRLKGQLGTGFSWKASIDEEYLKEIEKEVLTGEKQETSGWDTQIFRYRALKKGKVPMTYHYSRPWKRKEKPLKSFSCTVNIE